MQLALLMRGFVVFGVMLMHTTWFFNQNDKETIVSLSAMLIDILSLFAVPLFMFISGYIFISKHKHAYVYGLDFFKKMILSVLSPYILFSLIYIFGTYYYSNAHYTLQEIIQLLITGSAAVHLGFFRALFGFYIFYPLIIRYFSKACKTNQLNIYFAAVIFLQLLWKSLNNLNITDSYFTYPLMLLTFLRYISYFSFGMVAWVYHKQLISWLDQHNRLLSVLLLVCFPLVAFCWQAKYYWHSYDILEFICFPLNLILYTIIIAIIFRYTAKLTQENSLQSHIITYIGNYSFGIFLMHIIFMHGAIVILQALKIMPASILFYPLLFILMLLFSIISMEIIRMLPLHHYLVGKVQNLSPFKK